MIPAQESNCQTLLWVIHFSFSCSLALLSQSLALFFSASLSLLLRHSLYSTQFIPPFSLFLSFFPSLFFLLSLSLSFSFFSLTPSHQLNPTHFISLSLSYSLYFSFFLSSISLSLSLSLSFSHPLTHSIRLTSSLPLLTNNSRTISSHRTIKKMDGLSPNLPQSCAHNSTASSHR